jgi:hypothetical protein
MDKATFDRVYDVAEHSFTTHLSCALPKNVELTVQDATLIQLNLGYNVFGPNGINVRQGFYLSKIKTILLASERPDKRLVLFHELLHFFMMESPNCGAYSKVEVQHKWIDTMEEDYFTAMGTTQEQEADDHWVLDYLRSLR